MLDLVEEGDATLRDVGGDVHVLDGGYLVAERREFVEMRRKQAERLDPCRNVTEKKVLKKGDLIRINEYSEIAQARPKPS